MGNVFNFTITEILSGDYNDKIDKVFGSVYWPLAGIWFIVSLCILKLSIVISFLGAVFIVAGGIMLSWVPKRNYAKTCKTHSYTVELSLFPEGIICRNLEDNSVKRLNKENLHISYYLYNTDTLSGKCYKISGVGLIPVSSPNIKEFITLAKSYYPKAFVEEVNWADFNHRI